MFFQVTGQPRQAQPGVNGAAFSSRWRAGALSVCQPGSDSCLSCRNLPSSAAQRIPDGWKQNYPARNPTSRVFLAALTQDLPLVCSSPWKTFLQVVVSNPPSVGAVSPGLLCTGTPCLSAFFSLQMSFTCFCFSRSGQRLEHVQMDPGHTFLFLCYFFVSHLPCPFCGCLWLAAWLLALSQLYNLI